MSSSRRFFRDKVFALPLSGESFLLRRAGYSVLVDGGWKTDDVAVVLKKHFPALDKMDAVICTHGDGDHAAGLPQFLQTWPGQIGQVWLPGRWVEVIPRLIKDPSGFMDELIEQLRTVIRENAPNPVTHSPFDRSEDDSRETKETKGERDEMTHDVSGEEDTIPDDIEPDFGSSDTDDDPPWFADLRVAKDLPSSPTASRAFEKANTNITLWKNEGSLSDNVALSWLGMVNTVKAIRDIAAAAIARHLRVRWFDYDAFAKKRQPKGGVPGFLQPINAREQAPVPSNLNLLMALTLINRESLVFYAPPGRERLGVLFCGDSPLGDGPGFTQSFLRKTARPFYHIISTAPHHGSDSNKAAYRHIGQWADVAVFLRAGGKIHHPGRAFKDLAEPVKLCAKCPAKAQVPSIVGVTANDWPAWCMPRIIGDPCKCV